MDTVPTMISTKDLDYIYDMYSWNFNSCKEINHFINEVSDQEIVDLLKKCAKAHKKICQNLVTIIE